MLTRLTQMITRLGAEPPLGLAALRIALGAVILISPELWQAPYWAGLPADLRFAPEGLGWALAIVPIDPYTARVAQVLLIVSCAAAILGLGSRLAMLGVTLFGLYVFGLSQLSGAVIHNNHLFWFSALLAVSPCGDALSLQRWLRSRPYAMPASSVYTVPLQCARILLAAVYFFPGLWKLETSGLAWIFSDNLRNQIYWKWYQLGAAAPTVRLDQVPWLLQLAALAVVVFELSFIALIWSRRGRMLGALAGVLFHLGTQWIMGITFISLIACYVILVDWRTVAPAPAAPVDRRALPAALLGSLLIAFVCVQGARGAVQAWPFGCYPTFDRIVDDQFADLRIEAVHQDGTAIAIPDGPSTGGHPRAPQDWARAWRLAGYYDGQVDPVLLGHYAEHVLRDPQAAAAAKGAARVRFYAATYSVLPERRGQAPLSLQLLAELPLPITAPTHASPAPRHGETP